jgi:hypothetical protein
MQRPTPVFIVTSSRPRVGKTLIARALTEFYCIQRRSVVAFDVNPDDFAMLDYLPAYTEPINLREARAEVKLFDRLVAADQAPKVVDLGHVVFDRFFAIMQQIEYAVEAERRNVIPVILFVADPDERARRGFAKLIDRFPSFLLIPVFNQVVPQISLYRDHFPLNRSGGPSVSIPALTAVVRAIVDRPGFSFNTYSKRTRDTTTELYDWIRRVFVVFRELEVRLLLHKLKSDLKRSA